jgi:hypothetical protein
MGIDFTEDLRRVVVDSSGGLPGRWLSSGHAHGHGTVHGRAGVGPSAADEDHADHGERDDGESGHPDDEGAGEPDGAEPAEEGHDGSGTARPACGGPESDDAETVTSG